MLIPYFYTEIKCPYCKAGIDTWLLGLNSGLGPPLLTCRKCSQIVQTGRREWREMQRRQRRRYYLISTLYVALAAFLGGVLTKLALVASQHGMDAPIHIDVTDPLFLQAAILWGGLVAAFQFLRLRRSQQRTAARQLAPAKVSFWSLDYNLQLKSIILFVGIIVLPFLLNRLF